MNSRCESSKNTKTCLKSQQLEDISLEDKIEGWLLKFNKTRSRNYQHLEQLLSFYTQKIISSVAGSNEINLKKHINKMLIFFHLYWLDIKQDIVDHSQYLNKMSALLHVYVNIELKTSMEKRISNQVRDSKIAAKILTALYIYLNNSEEHIFRVLLRIKHTTEKYTKICNHIFTKSFTNLKTQTISINDVTYVRYLLAFKMWRKIEETIKNLILKKKLILSEEEVRRFEEGLKEERINKLALKLLGSRMPELQDKLKFVPRPPEGQENETLWLIQSDLFDKKEVHKKFLLFEDKMDNSTDLKCNKTIYTDQNCSKSQKHQMDSLFYQSNSSGDTSEKIKKYLGGLRNNKTLSNNENRSMDQIYPQIKGSKSLKRLRKKREKPMRKPIDIIEIIDLTGDDKRKRIKNSKFLSIMKNIIRGKKHINSSKYSYKLLNADIKKCSNENNKNLKEKISESCSEYKPVNRKISDGTEICTSVNLETNEHLNDQMNNTCLEFLKEDEKSAMFVDQNVKANVSKESKSKNCVSSYEAYVTIGNAISSYNNSQNKEALKSQEESAMETIPLFKTCQNNIADQHSFKQELPTSTNYSAMQKSHKYCNTMAVDDDIKHHILKKLESIQDNSSQITKIINQKVRSQVNECPKCYTKIDCKPFIFTNDITAAKVQGTLHDTFNGNENDIKSACDTNVIYALNNCNKCVYVVNHHHIDECVSIMHAEKKVQRLGESDDTCTVSTTFTEDQIDYDNAAKYFEAMIKEQQKRTNCDSSVLNDRLHFSESCIFDVNSFDIGSNAEVENYDQYDLKGFSKIEETDEITKTDVDDSEHINSNNILNETLEDFFRQSSEPQINCNNLFTVSTKQPLVYDSTVKTLATQNTLHNIFNTGDTNIICMLSDRNKCIYVTNTGERIMTSTEKRMQCLNNSNDMCTVSTTFTGDQIVDSFSFDSQHVNSDNRRKCDYKDISKYSEDTMKEQQEKSNYDTSMLNEQLHPTELCTFDFIEIEANEIMKTDSENISFLHNTETLDNILSNVEIDTTDFLLPLKQSI